MKIRNFNFWYTGGGIYIFTGRIAKNEWFVAQNTEDYLDITDANFYDCNFDEDEDCGWFEKHSIRTPDEQERHEIFKAIYQKVANSKNLSAYALETIEKNWNIK